MSSAKICSFACAVMGADLSIGYGYAWVQDDDSICSNRPPVGGDEDVYFAVAVASANYSAVIIDQGIYNGGMSSGIPC